MTYHWQQMSKRERDALVAEKVMGWTRGPGRDVWFSADGRRMLLPALFSRDIGAAWQVVERMQGDGWGMSLSLGPDVRGKALLWSVMFDGAGFADNLPTAPEAICLAALRACGVEVEP